MGDLVEGLLGRLSDDGVEEDIGDCLIANQRGVARQPGERPLAGAEKGHVAEGGHATGEGGGGPAREVVHPGRPLALPLARGQGEVDVGVHPARQEELAGGVQLPVAMHLAADLDDRAPRDANVGRGDRVRGNDSPAPNHQIQFRHPRPPLPLIVCSLFCGA